MIERMIHISGPRGLDMDLVAELCKKLVLYKCRITLICNDQSANGKSLLSVLGSDCLGSSCIKVRCEGVDEDSAMNMLVRILEKENSGE